MKITLITVGKIKEKYWNMAIDEYSKRLSSYCKLNIISVPDEKTKEGAGENENKLVKECEGKKIIACIPEKSYVIAMAIEGKMLDSVEFSKKIENIALSGISNITFIIGGSLGLSHEVLSKADYKLSFSCMTFPHQMMRVIFLEQLYRAFKISSNEPYHK